MATYLKRVMYGGIYGSFLLHNRRAALDGVQSVLIRRQDVESAFGTRCVPARLILKTSFVYALSFGSFSWILCLV